MNKPKVAYTYNGILFTVKKIYVTTWMNLEDIMLSEIARHTRTNIVRFYFYKIPRVVRFLETESRRVFFRGWEAERMGSDGLMGTELHFGMLKKF